MDFFDFIFVHLVSAYLKFRVKTLSCLKRAFFLKLGKDYGTGIEQLCPCITPQIFFLCVRGKNISHIV